jgi:hypothetical protein
LGVNAGYKKYSKIDFLFGGGSAFILPHFNLGYNYNYFSADIG